MTGKWILNDTELGSSTTRVIVTQQTRRSNTRVSKTALHGGTEDIQAVGTDYPTTNLQFKLLGSSTSDKQAISDFLEGTFSQDEPWILEAPAGLDMYANKSSKAAVFLTDGGVQYQRVGASGITVTVPAVVLGSLGEAEIQENLVVTFLDNDFYTDEDDTGEEGQALIGVPVQVPGYIKAINSTTYAKEEVTLLYTIESSEGSVEIYGLEGYVIGEPLAEGESGPASIFRKDAA